MEKKDYGFATVGVGSPNERKIAIEDFVAALYKDDRKASICGLENNEGFIVSIENYESSNRSTQKIWVSEESLMAIFSTIMIYYSCKGLCAEDLLKKSTKGVAVEYTFSDNLHEINAVNSK